jgi:hypothetical protein
LGEAEGALKEKSQKNGEKRKFFQKYAKKSVEMNCFHVKIVLNWLLADYIWIKNKKLT